LCSLLNNPPCAPNAPVQRGRERHCGKPWETRFAASAERVVRLRFL